MGNSFFYQNRGEQAALIMLMVGIILLKSFCFNHWNIESEAVQKRMTRDSVSLELQAYAQSFKTESIAKKSPEKLFQLKHFDPNLADSTLLDSLGLSLFVVRNIIKYRNRGGVFRQKSDLAKIYGLSQEDYMRLEAYILLPEQLTGKVGKHFSEKQDPYKPDPQSHTTKKQGCTTNEQGDTISKKPFRQTLAKNYCCLINSADTATLLEIPGIGPYTAKRILDYRERLGGFCSRKQLDEIAGLYPENLEVLKRCLQIDSSEIRKLNLNQCSLEQFRVHPYLNFYQSKALVELRLARGRIESTEDLLFLEEFTTEDLRRLRPYLGS